MYHRFPNTQGLELQCRHLRDHYQPVSMNDAAEMLSGNRPLTPYAVAVTVDDGYRDFYTSAYPIFSAYRIPVTVYLVTDFLDGNAWLWVDQVRYLFHHTKQPQCKMALPGRAFQLSCMTEEERRAAGRDACEALKQLSNEDRLSALRLLPELLEVELPATPPRGSEPLVWDEVRALAQAGVEFGSHTRRHPILSKVGSATELDDEIIGSKRRMEGVLETKVRHFCYPNGARDDISPEAVETVRRAGFETAVVTEPGLNRPGEDLLRLRRIGVDPRYQQQYFEQCAAAFGV